MKEYAEFVVEYSADENELMNSSNVNASEASGTSVHKSSSFV